MNRIDFPTIASALLVFAIFALAARAQTPIIPTPAPTPLTEQQKLDLRLNICAKNRNWSTVLSGPVAGQAEWAPEYVDLCAKVKSDAAAFYAARDAAKAAADLAALKALQQ